MAITHVASATKNEATPTTSLTITIPASVQANDILIVCLTNRGSTSAPSVTDDDTGGNAWAMIANQTGDTTRSGSVWWKRATSGTASKTITASGFTQACSGGVSAYRGAATGATPHEAASGESNASADESHAAITVSAGSLVCLCVFNVVNDRSVSGEAATDPASLTQRFESLHTGAGTDNGVSHASAVKSTAGSTGALTWTQLDNATASIAFGLKEAAAGGGGQPPRTMHQFRQRAA